jgi:hypothetical protein
VLWQKGLKICQDNICKNNNQEFFMQKSASLYRALGTYYQTKQNLIVSDNIEVGMGNKIPLWLFGFLY